MSKRHITIVNEESGQQIRVKVRPDSTISKHQARQAQARLCPVGFPVRGVIGEYGVQLPPVVPQGMPPRRFTFEALPSGDVRVGTEVAVEE